MKVALYARVSSEAQDTIYLFQHKSGRWKNMPHVTATMSSEDSSMKLKAGGRQTVLLLER